MMFVDKILEWARNNGISSLYGSPEQINAMIQDTDFAASDGGTVLFCHLITDSETMDGRDTATVAVYFCRLCDFDFNGENLLPVQEELKDTGKQLLLNIERGNEMEYDGVRWQYGYDDYAENVAWVCLRVTLTASSADCTKAENVEDMVSPYFPAYYDSEDGKKAPLILDKQAGDYVIYYFVFRNYINPGFFNDVRLVYDDGVERNPVQTRNTFSGMITDEMIADETNPEEKRWLLFWKNYMPKPYLEPSYLWGARLLYDRNIGIPVKLIVNIDGVDISYRINR